MGSEARQHRGLAEGVVKIMDFGLASRAAYLCPRPTPGTWETADPSGIQVWQLLITCLPSRPAASGLATPAQTAALWGFMTRQKW
jgi:hypothetical protein